VCGAVYAQVALLGRLARDARLEGVEVLTVDKCQGRDKELVVLSLVRSNAEREAGKRGQQWAIGRWFLGRWFHGCCAGQG